MHYLYALMQTEGSGDGGAGKVGIKYGGFKPLTLGLTCKKAGDKGFAHTAFATDNGNYALDLGQGIKLFVFTLSLFS